MLYYCWPPAPKGKQKSEPSWQMQKSFPVFSFKRQVLVVAMTLLQMDTLDSAVRSPGPLACFGVRIRFLECPVNIFVTCCDTSFMATLK